MDTLLELVNKLYNLNLRYHEKVTKGFLSENHILIQDNTKYFLKKYRFNSKEKIADIHSVKKYFAEGGIPVILPLVNIENNTFFSFNDEYFALFPFFNGHEFERGSLTERAIISMGEMLGKIHLLGRNAKLSIKDKFKPVNKEKTLEKIETIRAEINKKEILTDFDKLALDGIETKKKLIASNIITSEELNLESDHLLHGDYLDSNLFFDTNGRVSAVFDFEKAYYAPRVYELLRSLVYSHLSVDVTDKEIKNAKLYLSSYLKIYPMGRDELERGFTLYYLKVIHGIWVESEHYLKNNYRADVFLKQDVLRMKYLSTKLEELKALLLN